MSQFAFSSKDIIHANERFLVKPKPPTPIDKQVSEIVGQEVRTTDPRLIKLAVKWKREAGKSDSDLSRDDFLYDAKKIKELKEAFK